MEGGGVTDPSLPMGQRGWRRLERGEMRSLSPPVGDFVGGIHERTSQRSPLVPPPTSNKGGDRSRRGWGGQREIWWSRGRGRRWGGRVGRPGSPGDGNGAVLRDGIRGRARADRREKSGGNTRCSRRYWWGNKRVRSRVGFGGRGVRNVDVEGVVVKESGILG